MILGRITTNEEQPRGYPFSIIVNNCKEHCPEPEPNPGVALTTVTAVLSAS